MVHITKGEVMKNLVLLRKAINSGCTSVADFAVFIREYSKSEDINIIKITNSSLPTLYKKTTVVRNSHNSVAFNIKYRIYPF